MKGMIVSVLNTNAEWGIVENSDKLYRVFDLDDLTVEVVSGSEIWKAVFNNIVFLNLELRTNKRYERALLLDNTYYVDKPFIFDEIGVIFYFNNNILSLWVKGVLWEIPFRYISYFEYWEGVFTIHGGLLIRGRYGNIMGNVDLSINTMNVSKDIKIRDTVYYGELVDRKFVLGRLVLGK